MLYERTDQGLRRFQGELPEAVAVALERADEDSIVAALGDERYSEEYLYCLRVEGRELVGISVAGAFEAARLLGNVEVLPEVKTECDEAGYRVVVRVRDNRRQVTLLGTAWQSLCKVTTGKPDPHAWAVAVSKAQRNGILQLVSSEARRRIIEDFLTRGRRRELGKVVGVQHQAEPAASGHAADAPKATRDEPIGPAMTPADFAAGCRQKGYRTFAEVCSTLGFPDKRSLVQYGLARALDRLPDRHTASQVPSEQDLLDEVDQGF